MLEIRLITECSGFSDTFVDRVYTLKEARDSIYSYWYSLSLYDKKSYIKDNGYFEILKCRQVFEDDLDYTEFDVVDIVKVRSLPVN